MHVKFSLKANFMQADVEQWIKIPTKTKNKQKNKIIADRTQQKWCNYVQLSQF